ncbi:MAG: plastocyanin/azurin family copper-binding protein [Gammaproteobacteria bacterium]|nr:plastocyanin/azurin family copper-binding protein [Gammaproteobacteria bacterium]
MTLINNPIKQWLFKPLLIAALLGLLGACGDNGQDSSSADSAAATDSAATEQAAPADSGSSTAREPEVATDSGTSDSEMAAADSEPAASDDNGSADSGAASGGERHTVQARATSYDPVVLKINPGDSVSWTNMSGHNVHFEAGNIPEGAETWQSPLGNDVNRTFDKEGLYLYKCDPHFALGMVGALIVGTPDNVAEVEQNAKGMYKRALAKAKAEL